MTPRSAATSAGSVHATDHRTSSPEVPGTGAAAPAAASPAEWARTLAVGTVAGTLHLPRALHGDGHDEHDGHGHGHASRTEPFAVRHLAGSCGDLLLLVDEDGPLAERLRELRLAAPEGHDVPAVLDVLDVPPGLAGIPRARLCASGWVEELPLAEQRRLAATAARPTAALLDLGAGRRLVRLDVGDVRVTTGGGVHLVGDDEYLAAAPDPLYADEHDLVGAVEAHHRDALVAWVLRELPLERARQVREVAVTGVDRHGLDVLCTLSGSTTALRGSFAAPVGSPGDLPRALCVLLGCPCRGLGHVER